VKDDAPLALAIAAWLLATACFVLAILLGWLPSGRVLLP